MFWEFLRQLGKVLHVSAAHNIILRAEGEPPRVGETVVNSHLKPVGIVYDVFGPVSQPYVSVKPRVSESSCAKQVLYVLSSKLRR